MAININLYPPIVETYAPAFLIGSGTDKDICRIYFSLSMFNSLEEIANAQVSVRNQYTNLSVLDKTKYPSEIMLTTVKEDSAKMSDDKYYIEIQKTDIQGGEFEINQYYKVQIRFTHKDAPQPTDNKLDGWLAANISLFSEWSTVCLVRGISAPILSVSGFTIEGGNISWANYNPIIYGALSFADAAETEKMKSYQIKLYDANGSILTDSGLQYTNSYNNPNSFEYALKYNFIPGESYSFTIEYTTLDLYSDIATYSFKVGEDEFEALDITFTASKVTTKIIASGLGKTTKRASSSKAESKKNGAETELHKH